MADTRLTDRRVSRRARDPKAWRDSIALPGQPAGAEPATPIWDALHGYGLPEVAADRKVLRRDATFRRLLAVVDVVATVLALFVAGSLVSPQLVVLPAAALLPPLVVLLNKAVGVYDRDEHLVRKTTIDEVPQILHTSVMFGVAAWLGEGFFISGDLSRAALFALVGTAFGATVAGRAAARSLALTITSPERCLVLGSQSSAARVTERLVAARGVKAHVIGRIALGPVSRPVDTDPLLVGHVSSLATLLSEHAVERVVIAPDGHDQEEILNAIRLVKALGVKVSVLPRLLEVVGSSSLFDEVDGITLLGVRRYGLSHSSEFLKRAMDMVVAAAGLLAIAPLLAALAAAVKLDSRGPVFFAQPRIGRNGRGFAMLKFRSMVEDADVMKDELRALNEADGLFKIQDDPRITRVGRFLRRTSLDELPQLFNVLRGDMSLVGPRPLVPDEDAMIEGWHRRRLAVKPGMTGLWQIFGSARIPMREMVKIDYLYGANWSLWLDLKILLRTVPHMLGRRGQ